MRIKKGDTVKIIADLSEPKQTEINLSNYIGKKCIVTGTPNSRYNCLDKGELYVTLEGEGTIILNQGEYERVVENGNN